MSVRQVCPGGYPRYRVIFKLQAMYENSAVAADGQLSKAQSPQGVLVYHTRHMARAQNTWDKAATEIGTERAFQ